MKGAIYAHLDTEDVVSDAEENSDSASQQVSADFKKSMDEYEQFFNKYADFVKTYKDSGSPAAMAYADVMAQYGETMQNSPIWTQAACRLQMQRICLRCRGVLQQKSHQFRACWKFALLESRACGQ